MTFGGNSAFNIVYFSATEIRCDTPTGSQGTSVNVVVTNPDSQSDTLSSGYTYTAPLDTTPRS